MEDIDNMDDKLFNNAFRKNPSIENNRKRITFAGSKNINQYTFYKLFI